MIVGDLGTREVFIDGQVLFPDDSRKLSNHSPDGFAWGYAGSGPAQLALALLLHFTDKRFALENYQQFKFDVIAHLDQYSDMHLQDSVIKDWCKKKGWTR